MLQTFLRSRGRVEESFRRGRTELRRLRCGLPSGALILIILLATSTFGAEKDEKKDLAIQRDRVRIRASLMTMDRVDQKKKIERMTLVADEGISGLDPDAKPPQPGDPAPDFELTPLKFYDFKTEKTDITLDNADLLYKPVKLSDFRGEKPVVLIFGSYT